MSARMEDQLDHQETDPSQLCKGQNAHRGKGHRQMNEFSAVSVSLNVASAQLS